ncbi:lipid A deacylase LpxR family protein [Hyphococcus sp.]|uniref:lipid A deacylase LpxR family protein n=1 Tax=Hyphococcus sp. TaxID=2038636 RepID=UPI003752E8F7
MSGVARAQDDDFLASYDDSGTFTFVWENDYFANTDRNYTNGLRLAYISGFKQPQGVSRWVADHILGAGESAGIRRGFALGHSIYTPQDKAATAPLPDEHPYAGWLYGEYSVVVEQADIIDQFTLQAGIVGPSAQGKFVQNNWHDLIGGDPVNGWDNQIGDEPGVVISYDRKFRAVMSGGGDDFGFDVTPSYGFSTGNIQTNGRVGLMLRLGADLRNDYGPPRVRPSLAGGGYFSPRDRFSWYLFAGAEGRAVAHDIFLDGSLFRSGDPSVDSNAFVGDFQIGVVFQVRRIQLAYTNVIRTREFTTQQGAQQFGAVSLSVKF